LLVSLKLAELERVTLTAMSLTDRPRPKLLAIRSPLGRHLYIFVWLPRDDVSTGMRKQIEDMLTATTGGGLLGWSISLEDGGIALLRYTLDLPDRDTNALCASRLYRRPRQGIGEALERFKIDSAQVPGLPAPCLGAKSSSIRRGSRASTCAPAPSRAGACAGPTGGTISAPRSWA
jgi:NAD-specific glutamate dehydrogenase